MQSYFIASLIEAKRMRDDDFTHVISINDPNSSYLGSFTFAAPHVLSLQFHDATELGASKWFENCVHPNLDHVNKIVEFSLTMTPESKVMAHCFAGISRSPAALLIAIVTARPDTPVGDLCDEFFGQVPWAEPNLLMLELASELGLRYKHLYEYAVDKRKSTVETVSGAETKRIIY